MVKFFRGYPLVAPQAASYVDDSALANPNLAQPGGVVALIGSCSSGQPKTPLTFTDPAQARLVLGQGPLVDAVTRCFAASVSSGGAGQVVALRVNPSTRATLTLADSQSPGQPAIQLVATDWGARTNLIRVQVTTPVSGGGKNLLVAHDDLVIQGTNIGQVAMTVAYTGAGTAATAAVSYTGGQGALQITVTGADDSLTLPFDQYPTLQALKDALEATGKFVCTINQYQSLVPPPTNPTPATVLDFQSGVDLKAPGGGALRADVEAQTQWFNRVAGALVQATRVVGTRPLADIPVTYLAGGADGTPTNADWADCLTQLQNVDCHLVVPVSPATDVHDAVVAHVNAMSGVNGKRERMAILGGDLGETPRSALNAAARAQRYQNARVVVVGPGLLDVDAYGNPLAVPPYLAAAQVAGLIASQGVAEPITRRYLNALGVEPASAQVAGGPLTQAECEQWLQQGVCVLQLVPNRGVRVLQGVTTWTGDSSLVRREISVRRAADWVARTVREAADEFLVGQRASADLLVRTRSLVHSVLTRLQQDGVLVGDVGQPAFRNIIVRLTGDLVEIEFEASPAVPANYVTITAHLTPFAV